MSLYLSQNYFAGIPVNDVVSIMARFGSKYNVSLDSSLRRRKYLIFVTNDRLEGQLDTKKELIPHVGC